MWDCHAHISMPSLQIDLNITSIDTKLHVGHGYTVKTSMCRFLAGFNGTHDWKLKNSGAWCFLLCIRNYLNNPPPQKKEISILQGSKTSRTRHANTLYMCLCKPACCCSLCLKMIAVNSKLSAGERNVSRSKLVRLLFWILQKCDSDGYLNMRLTCQTASTVHWKCLNRAVWVSQIHDVKI